MPFVTALRLVRETQRSAISPAFLKHVYAKHGLWRCNADEQQPFRSEGERDGSAMNHDFSPRKNRPASTLILASQMQPRNGR